MTLYIYNFDSDGNPSQKVVFNGNLYQPTALTWRLKLKSRYTNKVLDEKDFTDGNDYWLIELELDTYNDRYTQFNMTSTSEGKTANQFASGYYDYELQWSDQSVPDSQDPDTYTWNTSLDGLVKLKTSATENLAFEGPEKEYFPTNHYQGPNPDAESYVIYKD